MPGLHWPFVLAPLPLRKKKRVQPGFTAEELLYLKEVLAVVRPSLPLALLPTPLLIFISQIDSMHESDDTQARDPGSQLANHHAPTPTHTTPSRSPSASSFASSSSSPAAATTSPLVVPALRSRATEAKLRTHPSALGIFLVFLATLLLSHSSHQGLLSVSSLLGAACLGVGLKIVVASEDQALHLDPVVGKDRGRARGRGRRSRGHTASS